MQQVCEEMSVESAQQQQYMGSYNEASSEHRLRVLEYELAQVKQQVTEMALLLQQAVAELRKLNMYTSQ